MFIYLVVLGVNCFGCDHLFASHFIFIFFVDRKCLPRIHKLTLVVRYMYAYKVGACVCLFILTRKFGHSFGISVAKRSINVIK